MKKYSVALSVVGILLIIGLVGKIISYERANNQYISELNQALQNLKLSDDENIKLQKALKLANQQLKKLTGTLTKLEQEAMQVSAANEENMEGHENELDRWIGAITQLRNYIKFHPRYAIPEFQYLTTQDWLVATEGQMITEADYRKAMALLRDRAKRSVSTVLSQGIQAFSSANNGCAPSKFEDIVNYLPKDFDPNIISRYENNPSGQMDGVRVIGGLNQWIIKEIPQVDDIWDSRFYLSNSGGLMVQGINYDGEKIVQTAIDSYISEFGEKPTNSEQIAKYTNKKISSKNRDQLFKAMTNIFGKDQ